MRVFFVRVVCCLLRAKIHFFIHTAKPHSLYLTSTEASAALSPRAVARILRVPGVFALRAIAVAAPLKSFISGFWNGMRHVGSPLAVASNVPAPVTSNFTVLAAAGTGLPLLSTAVTVKYTSSSPSAAMELRFALMRSAAGLPAVRMVRSSAGVPSALYATTRSSPGS